MMNKFGRFFGRILAETCLKMDYFGSKSWSPEEKQSNWLINKHATPPKVTPTMISDTQTRN